MQLAGGYSRYLSKTELLKIVEEQSNRRTEEMWKVEERFGF